MPSASSFPILLVVQPGLETALLDEVRDAGFGRARTVTGGVEIRGGWPEVWRANLVLRGPSKVLVRIGAFRAPHLAQLDRRARQFPWHATLRSDVPVRIEATCRASRIYHAGAAAERIATAVREELGATVSDDAELCIKIRIDDDLCTVSLDTSGELLHRRGYKQAVGKAPMRENMAAMLLRLCGYRGHEPVVDPMCGSGTFVIEAAEMAAGLMPGRARRFAFEALRGFDASAWAALRGGTHPQPPKSLCVGSDRDAGAIRMSRDNAARAGVAAFVAFRKQGVSELQRPQGPPGLVIVNPPYGDRIGDRQSLFALYGALGKTLSDRFAGWRVGLITTDVGLARTTGLPFRPPDGPVAHGGRRIHLFRTDALG